MHTDRIRKATRIASPFSFDMQAALTALFTLLRTWIRRGREGWTSDLSVHSLLNHQRKRPSVYHRRPWRYCLLSLRQRRRNDTIPPFRRHSQKKKTTHAAIRFLPPLVCSSVRASILALSLLNPFWISFFLYDDFFGIRGSPIGLVRHLRSSQHTQEAMYNFGHFLCHKLY